MFTRFISLVFATVLLGPPLHSHGADPDEGKPTGAMSQGDGHGDRHQFVSHALRTLMGRADLGLSDKQVTNIKTIAGEYEKARSRSTPPTSATRT